MTHELDEKARPAACSCGGFSAAGSPTFVLRRFIVHLQDVLARNGVQVVLGDAVVAQTFAGEIVYSPASVRRGGMK